MLSFGGVGDAALANELDILNQPPPGTQHVIDDAGVLNKTTRKGLNDELSRLEVCTGCLPPCRTMVVVDKRLQNAQNLPHVCIMADSQLVCDIPPGKSHRHCQ